MRPKEDVHELDAAPEDAPRHSDVVPKAFSGFGLPHLSWQEVPSVRVPDERRAAWMDAYESSFDQTFAHCERGDWLVPLVYASGDNDERLARALLRFAHELALQLDAPDEALAVLEVAESVLLGELGKDLCVRIADNLIDEAYERFTSERQFERYYYCHCAAAVARLTARVHDPVSARDAIDAVHSGAAAARARSPELEDPALRTAAQLIREELMPSARDGRAPGRA